MNISEQVLGTYSTYWGIICYIEKIEENMTKNILLKNSLAFINNIVYISSPGN